MVSLTILSARGGGVTGGEALLGILIYLPPTCKINYMSTCNIIMFTCNLFISTSNIIMLTFYII